MQPIVFIMLCLWAVYSSQRFMSFSIKAFANNTKHLFKLPEVNINITVPSLPMREPTTITLPKIYFDDLNQILMLFP